MKNKNQNFRKLMSVGLEKTGTTSEKFYLLYYLLIMRKDTVIYMSKGRNVKQFESVFFLFGLLPVHKNIKVINNS